jgi:V8-like Glu-specific endopeptidase
MTLWDDARTLIAEGETAVALDLLESFLKGQVDSSLTHRTRPLLDEALGFRARAKRIALKDRQNLLTTSELEVETARLDKQLLSLIAVVERLDKHSIRKTSRKFGDLSATEKLMAAESHLRSTGWLAEGLRLASAVCRLSDGLSTGSGFCCRDGAIITNNHVISDTKMAHSFKAEFHFEEDASGRMRIPHTISLDPSTLFWTSAELDVTLVGLSDAPPKDIQVIPLCRDATTQVGDYVSIIQHPNGGPKQIAVTNNRVVNIYDHLVHYLTDTLPGSSGSPVFSKAWQVVAIHHAGGDLQKNSHGDPIFANEGILVSRLFADAGFRNAYGETTC